MISKIYLNKYTSVNVDVLDLYEEIFPDDPRRVGEMRYSY